MRNRPRPTFCSRNLSEVATTTSPYCTLWYLPTNPTPWAETDQRGRRLSSDGDSRLCAAADTSETESHVPASVETADLILSDAGRVMQSPPSGCPHPPSASVPRKDAPQPGAKAGMNPLNSLGLTEERLTPLPESTLMSEREAGGGFVAGILHEVFGWIQSGTHPAS